MGAIDEISPAAAPDAAPDADSVHDYDDDGEEEVPDYYFPHTPQNHYNSL